MAPQKGMFWLLKKMLRTASSTETCTPTCSIRGWWMWCKFGLAERERPTCKSEATTFSRSQTSCTSWKQRQARPFHLNNSRRVSSSYVTHVCWWYHRLMASSVQVAVDLRMLVPNHQPGTYWRNADNLCPHWNQIVFNAHISHMWTLSCSDECI